MGILLPFELAVLFLVREYPSLVIGVLVVTAITPPFMAAFVAATVRRSSATWTDALGVPPFLAARPLSSADLIGAKLRTTLLSTLTAWLLVLVAVPAGLLLSDTWSVVMDRASGLSERIGTPRTTALVALIVWVCMASTWKQLVQTMHLGLTRRAWIVKANTMVMLVLVCVLGPIVDWIWGNGPVEAAIWDAIPETLAVLVALKMTAAAWIAVRLYRSRLLRDRTLVVGAAWWTVAVLLLYGALAWFLSTPIFPRYVLLLAAILITPLARLSAAPLALAWNRHR